MTALYLLADELADLRKKLVENGNDEQTIRDTLDGEALDFDQKVLACAYAIRDLRAYAKLRKEAAKESLEVVRSYENKADRLAQYVIDAMQKADRICVRGKDFEVKPQKNAAHVEIIDMNAIPEMFIRIPETKPQIDRNGIAEALKAGQDVPGVRLSQKMRLRIK